MTKTVRVVTSLPAPPPTDRPPPHRAALIAGATFGNFAGVTAMVAIPLGVMLVPIATGLGWSRTAVAGGFLALSLAQAAGYPLAGWLADHAGSRPTLLAGFAALALTLLVIAMAPASPLAFYGLFAVAGLAGVMASTMVIAKLVSEWFAQRRGFWLGLVGGVGNGLGGMVMPAVTAVLVAEAGWRGAFAAIGGFMALVSLPVAWATLRPPARAAQDAGPAEGHTFAQAMRRPLFWAIFSAVPVGGGALTGVFANTVTILTSQAIGVAGATMAVTIFALTCVINEPLVGHMLDRAARPRRVAGFFLLAVVGLVALAHAHGVAMAVVGGVLTGMGLGVEFSVLPYLVARYFGLRAFGAILGVAYAGALVSNGISPVVLNAAYDHFGSYALGLYAVAGLMVWACGVFLVMPRFDEG